MDKKIVDVLVKADVIDPANKEVVSFGIRQVEYFFINVITILFWEKFLMRQYQVSFFSWHSFLCVHMQEVIMLKQY